MRFYQLVKVLCQRMYHRNNTQTKLGMRMIYGGSLKNCISLAINISTHYTDRLIENIEPSYIRSFSDIATTLDIAIVHKKDKDGKVIRTVYNPEGCPYIVVYEDDKQVFWLVTQMNEQGEHITTFSRYSSNIK